MNTKGEWAIVELMGHRTRAGWCSEIERFGTKMLRIDIPHAEKKKETIDTEPLLEAPIEREVFEASQFYAGSAIFSYTPCDEDVVRKHLAPYSPPARLQLRQHDPEDEQLESEEESESSERGPDF